MKTLVSHIERGSTADGPGIRTVVFLKGCPLSCRWCHNPECISYEREMMFYPEKCIGCNRCAEGCLSGAKVICGREISPCGIVEVVLRDRPFYQNGGGVTISGGEPLSHPEFCLELMKELKKENINIGIETSMYRFDEEILSLADLIMTDVKLWDNKLHIEYTGVPNRAILENIRAADRLGKPMIIRTPVIAGINDGEECISEISEFAKSLENAVRYELLPYHSMGVGKARALGKEQQIFSSPDEKQIDILRRYTFIRERGTV